MIRWLKKKCKGKQRSQDEVRLPITTTTTNCSSLVYKTGNSFEKTGNYSGAKDCDFSEFHVSGVYICNTVKQCVSTDSGLDCDSYFHDETESTASSTHQLVGSNRDGKDNLKSELYVQRRSRALHKTGKPARAHSVIIKSRSSTDKCRKWLSTNFLNKKAKEQSAIANTENFGRQVNSKSKSSQHIERLEVLKQIEDNWLESDNDSSDEDDPHQTMKILDYSREPGCFFQSDLSDSGNSSETKSCYSSVDSLSLCNEVKFPNFTTSTGFGTNKWYRS